MTAKTRTKKQTTVIKANTYPMGGDSLFHSVHESGSDTPVIRQGRSFAIHVRNGR